MGLRKTENRFPATLVMTFTNLELQALATSNHSRFFWRHTGPDEKLRRAYTRAQAKIEKAAWHQLHPKEKP